VRFGVVGEIEHDCVEEEMYFESSGIVMGSAQSHWSMQGISHAETT